jgi:hypothetical protein
MSVTVPLVEDRRGAGELAGEPAGAAGLDFARGGLHRGGVKGLDKGLDVGVGCVRGARGGAERGPRALGVPPGVLLGAGLRGDPLALLVPLGLHARGLGVAPTLQVVFKLWL